MSWSFAVNIIYVWWYSRMTNQTCTKRSWQAKNMLSNFMTVNTQTYMYHYDHDWVDMCESSSRKMQVRTAPEMCQQYFKFNIHFSCVSFTSQEFTSGYFVHWVNNLLLHSGKDGVLLSFSTAITSLLHLILFIFMLLLPTPFIVIVHHFLSCHIMHHL